jgi:hypothetical protein
MQKKNNIANIKKISSIDILNKYLLTSIFLIPTLQQVTFNFSYKDFLSLTDKNILLEKNKEELKYKLYIAFYLILFNNSLIKKKLDKNKIAVEDDNIFFTNIIKNKFLKKFIMFFFSQLKQKFLLDLNLIKIQNYKKTLYFSQIKLPLNFLFDFYYIFNSPFFGINLREFQVSIQFLFKNKNKSSLNIIKNIPFFWSN